MPVCKYCGVDRSTKDWLSAHEARCDLNEAYQKEEKLFKKMMAKFIAPKKTERRKNR